MKKSLYQQGLAASLLGIASISLLLAPNSLVSLLGMLAIMPIWFTLLVAYCLEYQGWRKAPELFILLTASLLAVISRTLLHRTPLPLELKFLLGIMIWGGVGSVAIALFIRHTIRNEQSTT